MVNGSKRRKQASYWMESSSLLTWINRLFKSQKNQKITDARLKVLSEKLNEAGNTASLKNVSAHFKPYFTDKLIKSIVQNKGLGTVNTYTAPVTLPEYISQTKAYTFTVCHTSKWLNG